MGLSSTSATITKLLEGAEREKSVLYRVPCITKILCHHYSPVLVRENKHKPSPVEVVFKRINRASDCEKRSSRTQRSPERLRTGRDVYMRNEWANQTDVRGRTKKTTWEKKRNYTVEISKVSSNFIVLLWWSIHAALHGLVGPWSMSSFEIRLN